MLGDICKLETAYDFDHIYIRKNGTAKYTVIMQPYIQG